MACTFHVTAQDGKARAGVLSLAHGQVETPVFMPVGTAGTVKTLVPLDLTDMGAEIMLANTYHLFLRPGAEVIKKFSGLHDFIGWQKPVLTDSGGFQIFSLARLSEVKDTGVVFRNHIDGRKFFLTPDLAVEIQETFKSDIHMVLDECPPYTDDRQAVAQSLQRSLQWAKQARQAKRNEALGQFGIVQGGVFSHLRQESCAQLQELDFEGYAIGGLSVGEPVTAMREMTAECCELLPATKPRYLMGVGTPRDLIESVAYGVDMFDCVMPTRNGRNGTVFTSEGRINIKGAQYRQSDAPLDRECNCYTCRTFTRAFLHHLFKAKEFTSMRLLSLHNLHFYLDFMRRIRQAIKEQRFSALLICQREIHI